MTTQKVTVSFPPYLYGVAPSSSWWSSSDVPFRPPAEHRCRPIFASSNSLYLHDVEFLCSSMSRVHLLARMFRWGPNNTKTGPRMQGIILPPPYDFSPSRFTRWLGSVRGCHKPAFIGKSPKCRFYCVCSVYRLSSVYSLHACRVNDRSKFLILFW